MYIMLSYIHVALIWTDSNSLFEQTNFTQISLNWIAPYEVGISEWGEYYTSYYIKAFQWKQLAQSWACMYSLPLLPSIYH